MSLASNSQPQSAITHDFRTRGQYSYNNRRLEAVSDVISSVVVLELVRVSGLNRFRLRYASPCSFVCWFDTKSTSGVSRKPLDLESLNFTAISTRRLPSATPNVISLSTSCWKL